MLVQRCKSCSTFTGDAGKGASSSAGGGGILGGSTEGGLVLAQPLSVSAISSSIACLLFLQVMVKVLHLGGELLLALARSLLGLERLGLVLSAHSALPHHVGLPVRGRGQHQQHGGDRQAEIHCWYSRSRRSVRPRTRSPLKRSQRRICWHAPA